MIKQRFKQASYMDLGTTAAPAYEFMGTGFTGLDENPGAKEKSTKYINDKSSTSSITGYEWQSDYTADQILSEKVIQEIVDIGKFQKTGEDAERDYVIVDLDSAVTDKENTYTARKIKVAIKVEKFGDDDGNMTCEGTLLGIGDVVAGTFDTTAKTFTAGSVVA